MTKATVDHLITLYGRTQFDRNSMPSWIEDSQHLRLAELSGWRSGSRIRKRTRPSRVESQQTWLRVLECLPHLLPGATVRYEYRYPYLDRDLVDFLFSIPREQLVRPGRRRSLMRRALRGIVPSEILERKRKAFCARGPMLAVARAGQARQATTKVSTAVAMGVVNRLAFDKALDEVVSGNGIEQIGALMRVLSFDSWLDRQIETGHMALPT
jgi:asparagine synthase (glutamine-hydrolysing)